MGKSTIGDLTGKKFGKLTVIGRGEDYVYKCNNSHEPRWVCKCDCGNPEPVSVIQHNLLNGHCHCCPECKSNKLKDLTGKTFGKLTVLRRAPDYVDGRGDRYTMWYCECSCPKHTRLSVRAHSLLNGHTKSCGCAVTDAASTHGMRKSPLYSVYQNMINRCYNKNSASYPRYGARGIYMCDEWREPIVGIQRFVEWGYKNGYYDGCNLSIDRIDNDGPYAPWNCRWADDITQANNKSDNVRLTYKGETHTIAEWARIVGIGADTMLARYHKGLSPELILSPRLNYGNPNIYTNSRGETHTIKEWSAMTGAGENTIYDRLSKSGWDIDRALSTPFRSDTVNACPALLYNDSTYTYYGWEIALGLNHGTLSYRIDQCGMNPLQAFNTPEPGGLINAIYFVDENNTPIDPNNVQ